MLVYGVADQWAAEGFRRGLVLQKTLRSPTSTKSFSDFLSVSLYIIVAYTITCLILAVAHVSNSAY